MSEQAIKVALSHVLTNVANYPSDVQARLLGADLSKVIGEATEAVMKTGLVEEVERLQRGLAAGRAEIERYRKRGEDSVKDPHLSWYQEDHHHNEMVAVESAMDDVLEELDKGLGLSEP